jgi:DnaJ-class molecular chaperone
MKCQHCQGTGRIAVFYKPGGFLYHLEWCPECNGSGTTLCCGDAREQPAGKDDDPAPEVFRKAKAERDEAWER